MSPEKYQRRSGAKTTQPPQSVSLRSPRLRASRANLTGFSDGERDLASIFDLSYRALHDDRKIMFRYLGLIPGPDADAYAAVYTPDGQFGSGATAVRSGATSASVPSPPGLRS